MIERATGPLDTLVLMVACYAAAYVGVKRLHEHLLANLLNAEVAAYLKAH